MTSGDGLEREMWGLHLEGFSVREIARRWVFALDGASGHSTAERGL